MKEVFRKYKKKCLEKYKYDIACMIMWMLYWLFLSVHYSLQAYHWQYWILTFFTIAFRYIGYKEGCDKEKNNEEKIEYSEFEITSINKLTNSHKLRDIEPGMFFSIIKNCGKIDTSNKYLKVENNNAIKVSVWNMSTQEFETLNNDLDVILYSCSITYTAKI